MIQEGSEFKAVVAEVARTFAEIDAKGSRG